MQFEIGWVGPEGAKSSSEIVEAGNARLAFRKFRTKHPNFRDDEGDFYVTIGSVGSDIPDWEAGEDPTGKVFFRSLG